MAGVEFREADDQRHESDPAAELAPQAEREEYRRRFSALERELEQTRAALEARQRAYLLVSAAWRLAKAVISERFGQTTGNLIRQGIETQVERELGEKPDAGNAGG